MTEKISLNSASKIMREAMRETVRRHSFWYLIQGGLMVLTGFLALVYPLFSSLTVVVFLGWLLIINGVIQGIGLIGGRHVPHFWLQLVSVVLSVIIGFTFLRNPEQGLFALVMLLIVFFMLEGLSKIIFALTIRPFPNWFWVFASGLAGIVVAIYLRSNLQDTSVWLLGFLLGVFLISEGASLGYLAWQVRKANRTPTT